MIRTLLLAAILLLPILAYGGNPSANLSIQVVPAGGGKGALPGSILPPGNWVNDLDEHFSGTSLNTNIWTAAVNNKPGGGGLGNCQVPGTLVVNNSLTIFPLPASGGQSNGCWLYSQQIYGTPGYFEANLQSDRGNGVWDGLFFEFGPNSSCGGDFSQNGGEVDLVEAFAAGGANSEFFVHWNGYASCHSYSQINGQSPASDAYHVWGIDYGDNNTITWYKDGTQIGTYAPSDGVGNWQGQFIFMDFGYNGGTATNPTGLQSLGSGITIIRSDA